jgi:hypothetical protein
LGGLRKDGGGASATFWREAGGTYEVDVASDLRDMAAGLRGGRRVARAASMNNDGVKGQEGGLSNEKGGDVGRSDELVLNVDGLHRSSFVQENPWASRA